MSCFTTFDYSTVPVFCQPRMELHFAEIKQMLTDLIHKEQVNQLWKRSVECTLHSIWNKICYQRACVSTSCQTDEHLEEDCDTSTESSIHINDIGQTAREEVDSSPSPSRILLNDEEDTQYDQKGQQDADDMIFSSSSSAHENEISKKMKYYQCSHCECKFSRKANLTKHHCPSQQKEILPLDETSQTVQEEENDVSSSGAKKENEIHHEGQQVAVEVIAANTSSDVDVEMSTSDASPKQPIHRGNELRSEQRAFYQCSQCGCKFSHEDEMSVHEQTHKNPVTENLTCDMCLTVFSNHGALSSHKQLHENTSFKCDNCSRVFVRCDHFIRHCCECLANSNGFKCAKCGRLFPTKEKFRYHSRYHQEKRHKCTLCAKAFHSSTRLTAHMVTHTGARPFRCEFCEKSYSIRKYLCDHIRNYHTPKQDNI